MTSLPWILLSILCGFSLATSDALTKRYFTWMDTYSMGLARLLSALPWILAACFFIPWVKPDSTFFLCLAAGLPLEIAAFWLYMRAIQVSPLSLTLPFLAFTPAFLVLTGWLVLGERLRLGGIIGIALIVAGAYALNFSRLSQGFWAPLKAIVHERGSLLMSAAALIYAITSPLGKLGILHSNPATFGATYVLVFTLLMSLLLPLQRRFSGPRPRRRPPSGPIFWPALALGLCVSFMFFSHWFAIAHLPAAYMIALKRTSLVFGVLYGAFWFGEERLRERLLGASIMLFGVFCISYSA